VKLYSREKMTFKRKDDPPKVQGYHVGGFSYIR
jgi:hypothetical protein